MRKKTKKKVSFSKKQRKQSFSKKQRKQRRQRKQKKNLTKKMGGWRLPNPFTWSAKQPRDYFGVAAEAAEKEAQAKAKVEMKERTNRFIRSFEPPSVMRS